MGKKYYKILEELLINVRENKVTKKELSDSLINNIDYDTVYDIEDSLVTDAFISLKHFASGEENLTLREIQYLLQCFNGQRKHSFDDRENGNID